jgi:hypothetical protein
MHALRWTSRNFTKTETQNDAISCGQLLKSHILKLYTVHIFFALVLYVGKTKNVISSTSRMKNNVHFRGGELQGCTTFDAHLQL